MDHKTVTVIVPVYNGKRSIKNCIESVCNQTYVNLEIIIVDDGSSDDTSELCDSLALCDSRIKIYHIANSGVSHARNYGLEQASGEFIQFVDGDDILLKDATRIFVDIMEEKEVDLVVCNYIKVLPEIKIYFNQMDRPGSYSNREYLCNTLKDPGHHYYGVVWNKFYRRDIIEEHGIRFIEYASLGEDFIFNLNYLEHAKRIQVIRNHLYYYNCTEGNTLSRYEKNIQMCKRELQNRYIIFDEYRKTFINMGMYEKYQKRIQQYWLIYLAMNLYYIKYVFRNWDKKLLQEWSNTLYKSQEIHKCMMTVSSIKLTLMVEHIWLMRTMAESIKYLYRKAKKIK